MKKYTLFAILLFACYQPAFSQDIDTIAQRKVDSLKKLLPTTKGIARVDMLNSIAHGLLWIWEDDDRLLYEALKYSDESLKLANKLNYKRGTGYAFINLFYSEAHQASKNVDENYQPGSHFQKAIGVAKEAIKIGDQLHDDILIGSAYSELTWLYRWRGKRDDYAIHLQKSIEHFEKGLNQNTGNIYTPLKLTYCTNCTGIEFDLGSLYFQLADLQILFKDETVQKLRKAIAYFEKVQTSSSVGNTYLHIANVLAKFNDQRTAIAEAKKALPFYMEVNDVEGEFDVYENLCGYYYELGDLENGLLYSKKAVRLAENLAGTKGKKDEVNYPDDNKFLEEKELFFGYYWIGRFYSLAGDYNNAFAYFRKASAHNYDNRWSFALTAVLGNLHRVTGNYDSALLYFNPKTAKVSLVRLYNDMKQYDKALQMFNEAISQVTERNNLANLGKLHAYAARAYYGKKNFTQALTFASKADALFNTTGSNLERIDNYELLSDIYQQVGKFDSAYIFLKQYNNLRDSVLNRQFYIRLNDFKKEAEEQKISGQIKLLQKDNLIKEQLLQQQILLQQQNDAQFALLNKDNKITNQQLQIKDQELQIKEQQLKEQTLFKDQKQTQLKLLDKENRLKDQQLKQQTFIRNALLTGLFLLLLVGILIFRGLTLKRRNERLLSEKKQAELQKQSSELEMQALRAQMNPHFIFNCLSSINRFIFKNDNKAASDYLTKFSRLIRMVLIQSQKKLIPLEDELEMLKLYLDMERMRFKDGFDYSITTNNTIDAGAIFIPPLLLQPFCENAIWHGLMHKDGQGHLHLSITEENSFLICTVTDNGIGREKAATYRSKSAEKDKSLGLKITSNRLALLNSEQNKGTSYQIEDVMNEEGRVAGTKVQLHIFYKNAIEEIEQYA